MNSSDSGSPTSLSGSLITKVCSRCKSSLTVRSFSPRRLNRDGLQSVCRPCHNAYVREWTQRNKEARLAKRRATDSAWREANRELVNLRQKPRSARAREVGGQPHQRVTPGYVARTLGMPVKEVPAELLALKRAFIVVKRELKKGQGK